MFVIISIDSWMSVTVTVTIYSISEVSYFSAMHFLRWMTQTLHPACSSNTNWWHISWHILLLNNIYIKWLPANLLFIHSYTPVYSNHVEIIFLVYNQIQRHFVEYTWTPRRNKRSLLVYEKGIIPSTPYTLSHSYLLSL